MTPREVSSVYMLANVVVSDVRNVGKRARDVYITNEEKVVAMCKAQGVNTDECGNNAVSRVASLIEKLTRTVDG